MSFNLDEFYSDNFQEDPTEVKDTIVVVCERLAEGDLTINRRIRGEAYKSDFWNSQPNGDHELHLNQGGIRYLDMPSVEKERLKKYLLPYFDEGHAFNGVVKVENDRGRICQVRIEPRK